MVGSGRFTKLFDAEGSAPAFLYMIFVFARICLQ